MSAPTTGETPPPGATLADYDYALDASRVALRPVTPRDAARLLVASEHGALTDATVRELPDFLRPGDRLVVNDSRVIPARLRGERRRAGSVATVELTLLEAVSADTWRAFAKPAKRLSPGDTIAFAAPEGSVEARVLQRQGPHVTVRFAGDPLAAGTMPLPPYIAGRRAPDARDGADYQTVYADPAGSVAAPTAGLHFTQELMERLTARGVGWSRLTLHVGAGTFLPVATDKIDEHEMHAERGILTAETADALRATRASGGRVVAVGTTALRLLEEAGRGGEIGPFDGETRLFIRPGFTFRAVDALMTNFHLPRSSLLMLVAAFVGYERMRAIYAHALSSGYRFYSYGDASLLFPPGQ